MLAIKVRRNGRLVVTRQGWAGGRKVDGESLAEPVEVGMHATRTDDEEEDGTEEDERDFILDGWLAVGANDRGVPPYSGLAYRVKRP